jgi:hypothetical protein
MTRLRPRLQAPPDLLGHGLHLPPQLQSRGHPEVDAPLRGGVRAPRGDGCCSDKQRACSHARSPGQEAARRSAPASGLGDRVLHSTLWCAQSARWQSAPQ